MHTTSTTITSFPNYPSSSNLSSCLFSSPLSSSSLSLPSTAAHHHHNNLFRPPHPLGYSSYNVCIQHQLNKTLNPKLRKIWKTRDWNRKVHVFSAFFANHKQKNLLFNSSKALSIGARVGVMDCIGMDLVACPPLVVAGDFYAQPFENGTFDFEFSNVFDHALYPGKSVGEIERTLKPGGDCVLHVALARRADKYLANDLFSVGPLVELFKVSS